VFLHHFVTHVGDGMEGDDMYYVWDGDEYMDDRESGERKICSIINQRVCYMPKEGERFDKGENALILK
jgi:hypothetical protein